MTGNRLLMAVSHFVERERCEKVKSLAGVWGNPSTKNTSSPLSHSSNLSFNLSPHANDRLISPSTPSDHRTTHRLSNTLGFEGERGKLVHQHVDRISRAIGSRTSSGMP